MSDEFKVQWSISLPPAAQYAKGHMLNLRGATVEEVEAQFDEILATADSPDGNGFIQKATEIGALFLAAQGVQDVVQSDSGAASSQASSSGSGSFCEHGQRVPKSGTTKSGPKAGQSWSGLFCPNSDKNCKPVWD